MGMPPFKIQKPIWNGKLHKRCVGIAEHRVGNAGIDIEIGYTDKHGNRLYPNIYHISREQLCKAHTQTLSMGVRVRILPIDDLLVKEERADVKPST